MTDDLNQRAAELFGLPEEAWQALVVSEIAKSQEDRAFDVDETLRSARPLPEEDLRRIRKGSKIAAFLFMKTAARSGVKAEDPSSEALLARFRRDVLREAGVDERLIRVVVP